MPGLLELLIPRGPWHAPSLAPAGHVAAPFSTVVQCIQRSTHDFSRGRRTKRAYDELKHSASSAHGLWFLEYMCGVRRALIVSNVARTHCCSLFAASGIPARALNYELMPHVYSSTRAGLLCSCDALTCDHAAWCRYLMMSQSRK